VTESTSHTARLVTWAHSLRLEHVPEPVRAVTHLAVRDAIGCMLGGAGTELAVATRKALMAHGGPWQSTVVGGGGSAWTPLAALLNAVSANALDYDDAFERNGKGMGHPGSTLVATGLAVAEACGASGEELLTAILAGYEVCNRVVEAIQPSPERHAQVWGVAVHQSLGAAVVAGRLAGVSACVLLDAVGLAGALATLPAARKWNWEHRPLAWLKDVVGPPAEAGVRGVLMAQAGYVGSRDLLDDQTGFWVMAGSDHCATERLTDGLGKRWTVQELAFKPYPACRWVHATLEAAEELVREHGLQGEDIADVCVGSFRDLVDHFNDPSPASMVDAEFSVPYTLAVLLLRIPPGPAWYAPTTLRDPAVLAMARKVRLTLDDEAQARHFRAARQTMGTVTLTDRHGRVYSRRVAVARGAASRPETPRAVQAKFERLAAGALGGDRAARLHATLGDLEHLADVRSLTGLLA
jgi:2-methylcitrate dehydratase PrpD